MTGDVAAGRYTVVLEHEGYTRVVRSMALEPATGAVPFDSRLTPIEEKAGSLDPYADTTIEVVAEVGTITFGTYAIPTLSETASVDVTTLAPGRHSVEVTVLNLPAGLVVSSISPPEVTVDVELVPASPQPSSSAPPSPSPSPSS